jgi:hypothetical protein
VQVKTVRTQPWYVNVGSFTSDLSDQVTIYVLLGREDGRNPVRYFIARNRDFAEHVAKPAGWRVNAFMALKAVEQYEDRWEILDSD